jgi:hypothetical protein
MDCKTSSKRWRAASGCGSASALNRAGEAIWPNDFRRDVAFKLALASSLQRSAISFGSSLAS